MLKSPINIISRPVECAIESSSSNRFIHSDVALGGRYNVQQRNGLVLGRVNSHQNVSTCDISSSNRRLHFKDSF